MKPSDLQDVADVCKLLGDPTRAGIVDQLMKAPSCVTDLCKKLDLPQQTVSHHLGLLRTSKLVSRLRRGKSQIYSLNRERLAPVKKFLVKGQ